MIALWALDNADVVTYPLWSYYPNRERPPAWVADLIAVVANAEGAIGSRDVSGLTSDKALQALRPGLEALDYRVESGKRREQRIGLPVLFGEQGAARVSYEVDAVHEGLGVLVEIEAGRGARGNAVYRDLIRSALIVDARFLALGVMVEYRHKSGGKDIAVQSYADAKNLLDAVYASQRLQLPFEGVLLFGY
jgi:hypothetical protein